MLEKRAKPTPDYAPLLLNTNRLSAYFLKDVKKWGGDALHAWLTTPTDRQRGERSFEAPRRGEAGITENHAAYETKLRLWTSGD